MGRKPRESTIVTKAFADRLSDLIQEKKSTGMCHEEICEQVGVASGAMSEWASDNKTANIESLYKLSTYFGVSADWLLGISETRSTDKEIKNACEHTGLSENAVSFLHKAYVNNDTLSKSIVAIIDAIILDESENHNLNYEISLALNSAKYCKVIKGPHGEDLLLPSKIAREKHEAIENNANQFGMSVFPPDIAAKYYIKMAENDISQIVKKALTDYCISLSILNE